MPNQIYWPPEASFKKNKKGIMKYRRNSQVIENTKKKRNMHIKTW